MRHFSTTLDVAAPPERVWEVMADVERWHEWTASIRGVRWLDGGSLAVGSRALVRQPGLPPARWRVTELQPGRGFTWVSVAPGIRTVARHLVEPVEPGGGARGDGAPLAAGSRVSLSIDIEGVLGGMLGWMTARITRRYLGLEAAGLKARSETGGAGAPVGQTAGPRAGPPAQGGTGG